VRQQALIAGLKKNKPPEGLERTRCAAGRTGGLNEFLFELGMLGY
jgi:hypothetical protein